MVVVPGAESLQKVAASNDAIVTRPEWTDQRLCAGAGIAVAADDALNSGKRSRGRRTGAAGAQRKPAALSPRLLLQSKAAGFLGSFSTAIQPLTNTFLTHPEFF
jgi:hypothetical protein